MKKQILFLTLCISLLLSGCQKAPEAPPAVQAEEAPVGSRIAGFAVLL